MIIAIILILGVLAFLLGFICGMNVISVKPLEEKSYKESEIIKNLNEEYSNFLSYDGSVQQ